MTKYDSFRPFRKEQTLTNQNQASREITVRDSVFPKDKNRETEFSQRGFRFFVSGLLKLIA